MVEETFGITGGLGETTTLAEATEEKKTLGKKVRIIDYVKIPSADPSRIGKFDVVIVYMTEEGRTYMVSVPEEEFSEDRIADIIRKDLEKRARLIGKEITV